MVCLVARDGGEVDPLRHFREDNASQSESVYGNPEDFSSSMDY